LNPDPANLVDPDPDPGIKKLLNNKVLKIEFKWTFFNLKNSDQIYFYFDSWCSAGGILEPGTVFFKY